MTQQKKSKKEKRLRKKQKGWGCCSPHRQLNSSKREEDKNLKKDMKWGHEKRNALRGKKKSLTHGESSRLVSALATQIGNTASPLPSEIKVEKRREKTTLNVVLLKAI